MKETPTWEEFVLSFLFVGVLLRGIILPWLGKLLVNLLKEIFLKTEEEIALWNHYHHKAKHRKKESKKAAPH